MHLLNSSLEYSTAQHSHIVCSAAQCIFLKVLRTKNVASQTINHLPFSSVYLISWVKDTSFSYWWRCENKPTFFWGDVRWGTYNNNNNCYWSIDGNEVHEWDNTRQNSASSLQLCSSIHLHSFPRKLRSTSTCIFIIIYHHKGKNILSP